MKKTPSPTLSGEQCHFVRINGARCCEPTWKIMYGGFPFQSRSGVSRWKSEADARKAFSSHLKSSGSLFDFVRMGMIGKQSPDSYHLDDVPVLIRTLEDNRLLFFVDTMALASDSPKHFGPN
jgi:hypothetical protein